MKFFLLFLIQVSSLFAIDINTINWVKISDDDGIKVYRAKEPHPENGLHAFKVQTIFNFPMPKIISVLVDTPRKKEWVPRHIDTKYVQIIGPYERIEYTRYKAPWPFEDRDFVLHIKAEYDALKKQFFVSMTSVKDKRMPKIKDVVRASSYITHVNLIDINSGKSTDAEMFFMADLKGNIPLWAMDIIQKIWPQKILSSLTKQLKKKDIKINKDFLSGLGIPI